MVLKKNVNEITRYCDEEAKGVSLPFDPCIKVYSVIPDKCFVFSSAVAPLKLTFEAKKFP